MVLHGIFQSKEDVSQCRWLIAMQLCHHDLFERVQRSALQEPEVVEISLGLLSALAHLHSLRIVHRDVKADARRVVWLLERLLDGLEMASKRPASTQDTHARNMLTAC